MDDESDLAPVPEHLKADVRFPLRLREHIQSLVSAGRLAKAEGDRETYARIEAEFAKCDPMTNTTSRCEVMGLGALPFGTTTVVDDVPSIGGGAPSKKRNPPGLNRELIRSALIKWHGYKDGGVKRTEAASLDNLKAIIAEQSNCELTVADGSFTKFFVDEFKTLHSDGSYAKYEAVCRQSLIAEALKRLNGEGASLDVREYRDD